MKLTEFKIMMIYILKVLLEKLDNMNEQIGNFKRKGNCKKKSTRNAKKRKAQ